MKKWQLDFAKTEIEKAIRSLNDVRTNLINIDVNVLRERAVDETEETEIREVPE